MFKRMLMGTIILAFASIATAQSNDYKRFEFFAGYSHNQVDTGIPHNDPSLGNTLNEREGLEGFNAAMTGNVSRYVGLKFDFSGHFMKRTIPSATFPIPTEIKLRLYNFLGGVQLKDNASEGTVKPFAHALLGAANRRLSSNIGDIARTSSSDTGLAGAFGGGLDVRVSPRVDFRAVQLDYNPTRFIDSNQHNLRIGVGIVLH